jgi:hypothetical protein
MTIGRLSLHIGPSAWQDRRCHFFDGRGWPAVMTRMSAVGPVMGRGVVLAAGGWMLWLTLDQYVLGSGWLNPSEREGEGDEWGE